MSTSVPSILGFGGEIRNRFRGGEPVAQSSYPVGPDRARAHRVGRRLGRYRDGPRGECRRVARAARRDGLIRLYGGEGMDADFDNLMIKNGDI